MSTNYRRGLACCAIVCGLPIFAGAFEAEQGRLAQLVAATKSQDEATQIKAIDDLGAEGAPAIGALAELLRSESPLVRSYAARALGTIGPAAKSAAENLIPLFSDPDPGVRRQALRALIAIQPDQKVAMPILLKLVQDSDPGVRLRVMQAVADAKGLAVPRLIEALKDDGAAYWACLVLRDIGPDAAPAVPALVEKLKDRRPEIRREAILALAAIGSPDVVDKIVPLLTDESARTAATYALGALGRIPTNAEPTLRANTKAKDGLLSETSLWALARVHPNDMNLRKEAVTQLIARLKDQDPFTRAAAARALAALPPSPEIYGPIFEKALADADESTTRYMLDALAGLGPPAVPKLIKAFKYEALRLQIASILGQIGPPAAPATSSLAKLLKDADPNVSVEAANALAKIGPGAKAAVPALIDALGESENNPRYAAAYALGMIGPDAKPAAPALRQILKGKSDSLSLLCAWALVRIQGASEATAAAVLPNLVAGLQSPLQQSRETAAETLGSLGPLAKSSVPQLERLLKDDDEHVRAAADKAIKSILK